MRSAEDVIDSMYEAVFAGDVETALSLCASDAEYHAVTPGPSSGIYPIRTYLSEILPAGISQMNDYAVTSVERDSIDELVVSRVRSTHGSGVMVFRVCDGKIRDIWAINSKGRESAANF